MVKEWFSAKELITIHGLPSTIQGINRKARVEKWQNRKRLGVQGKAIEYHIDSFPDFVKVDLKIKQNLGDIQSESGEFAKIWLSAYAQLTRKEQKIVANWLLRQGLRDLLLFISLTDNNRSY